MRLILHSLIGSLLLFSVALNGQSPPPPCSINSNTAGAVVSGTIATGQPAPPYTTELSMFSAALGSVVDVTGALSVEICFWGDFGEANETFDVVIAGQTTSITGAPTGTTAGNPYCQTIMVNNNAALETDLADGDIDVSYTNFGAGFTNDPMTSSPDDFNAQVRNYSMNYEVPVTIDDPADRCTDGGDIAYAVTPVAGTEPGDMGSFLILPSTPGFNTTTGAIDVSMANPGDYTVTYKYTVNGCDFRASTMVSIFAAPVANLKDTKVSCLPLGSSVDLGVMFDGVNTSGGTFAIVNGPGGTISGSSLMNAVEGCYEISYTTTNPNNCGNAPYTSQAFLSVSFQPVPAFTLSGGTSPICSTSPVSVTVTPTSSGDNQMVTINGGAGNIGANSLAAPNGTGSIVYDICLSESSTVAACGSLSDTTCTAMTCQRFTVYNDGNDCGAGSFPSECPPDLESVDVCEVEVNNNLSLSCSFFTLNGPQIIEASLDVPGLLTCEDEEFNITWQGSLAGAFGDAATGGPTLRELGGAASEAICYLVADFEICIPLPFVDDICIDPIPLPSVEEACDQTIGQFVADLLADLVGGDGGSGMVVADTDGDGAFDYALDGYSFPANGSDAIPNNIRDGSGVITVRNVTAWPFNAADVCGQVSGESINLLELLPIGAIPIVGVIIEDVLASASCNSELVFTDEETIQIPVVNSSAPEFANCNTNGYYFSEDGVCDTEANWSIPTAYDGCGGTTLPYRGHTAAVDVSMFAGTPGAAVAVTESGIYQTAGPLPGSDLPVGTYSVTYTAYSCAGIEGTCTFDVIVTSGDPVLQCPASVTLKADADECTTNVSGFEPLQGPSCASVLNYSIAFADGTTAETNTTYSAANLGTNNNISGLTFPLGENTITYTLMIDINGDGDVDDDNETQTCEFTITVTDNQRPVAQCVDVEVKLDNTGNITIFAEDQQDGTAFVDGGSTDNCDTDLDILVAKPGGAFAASASFDCTETGYNLVNLQVTDDAGNQTTCISQIYVEDFFEGIQFDLDIPELCLEANNPSQLDFSNYLIITLPDGTTLSHDEVENNTYLGDAVGAFGITAFAPSIGSASADPGSVSTDGVFTPGDGTGFVTVSYAIALPTAVVQNNNAALTGCLEIVHAGFELRQPLDMESPECECVVQNDRVVDLGEITGGLEPYTIQFGGVKLDVDGDGVADDVDGTYTYDVGNGHDIADFTEDLGNLLVDYTQPTWSFTIVDARGCELFRSGSCDNDDENGTPEIDCADLGPVDLYTERYTCERQYEWTHTLPTDNCDVILYTYTITNPDGSIEGPFDLTALLNPDITNPLPDQFMGEYEFQRGDDTVGTSVITYYAEDAVGNFSQCSWEVTVRDSIPPVFINCPEPAVIVAAPATWCSAFANYSLPLASDNCDIPVVTQVDSTGLTSGDLYPVGITINTFEAVDRSGNSTRCDVKVIVNDFHTPPTFECPADVAVTNDDGDCGAVVDNIEPTNLEDNCIDNVTTIYRIDDEDGNEIANGLDDASGTFFELGTSTVRYAVQDMPLLLITEVTHDISNAVDGTEPIPPYAAANPPTGDYLEITNFNSATLDVSCLMVERITATRTDSFAIPTFTMLEPGEVLTIHYGPGTHDQDNNFFNVSNGLDLEPTDDAAYVISLSRSIIDVLVVGDVDLTGLEAAETWDASTTISPVNGAGVIRTTVWDTDSAADFVPGEACIPTTIGSLNPQLPQPTPNGAQTAIQAQPTVRVECEPFTVTVTDEEAAVCGLYSEWNEYAGGPITINFGECIETTIPVADAFNIADVNLNLEGTAGDMGNLTITLISPEGTAIELAEAVCAGTDDIEFTFDGDFGPIITDGCGDLNSGGLLIMPTGDIEAFNGEAVNGDWVLQIGHNGQESMDAAEIASFILFISARDPYDQTDETLENDPGVCEAEFTYFHPILFDNCPGGSLLQEIIFEDGNTDLSQTLPIFPENTEFTYNFKVGVSTVRYTLTDSVGNVSMCSFDVTVLDTENPVLVCPADTTLQLESGECDIRYYPTDWSTSDNCFVSDTIANPSFSTPLPIGESVVTLTVRDSSGNDTTCMYTVTVLENIPDPVVMSCITNISVHLDQDCEQEIIPQMVLTGNDFFCFDNYVVTVIRNNPDGTQDTLPNNAVGIDEIGEEIIYTIHEPRTDQTCWGYIEVGFFEAPEFICPADTTVACNAFTDVSYTGEPVLLSCALAGATVTHADTLVRNEDCDDPRAVLYRTWLVTDNFGNSASCVQTITYEAFDLADIVFPPNYDNVSATALSCVAVANNPTLTDPINTGFPTVLGGSNIFQNNFCSASFLYTDEVFEICPGSYEIIRTWKVRNTCQPFEDDVNPRESVQLIRVLDAEVPVITCPDSVTVSTGVMGCNATYAIPAPVVEEGCSSFTYTVSTSAGDLTQLPSGQYVVSGLQLGVHSVRYEVEDECGRYSECIYYITVNDQITGSAICEDALNVSLDANGHAQLEASDVDGGSDDLCGTVELSIRRTLTRDLDDCSLLTTPVLTDWGPTVDLNCCDIPDSTVNVELRVIDEEGNESTCWTSVLVEDKLNPVCVAPLHVQVNCNELSDNFPNNLETAYAEDPVGTIALLDGLFGTATGVDNCGDAQITQTVQDSRTTCGVGLIVRTFTATDDQGLTSANACFQRINVLPVHDYTIVFPGDRYSDEQCVEPDFNGLRFESSSCDLITTTTSVDTFQATADECYKLRVAYEIINWCEYQTEAAAYVIPRDADNDDVLINDSTVLHIIPRAAGRDDDIAYLDRDEDRNNGFIDELDTSDGGVLTGANSNLGYGRDPSRGFFKYNQFILVYDNTPPSLIVADTSFCSYSVNCDADPQIYFDLTDICSPTSVSVVVELDDFIDGGDDNIYTLADFIAADDVTNEVAVLDNNRYRVDLNNIPIGRHALRVRASDGCGNAAVDLIIFEVNDCKAPTPICINGLTSTLMPDGNGGGMSEIWVSDFIASPSTDCSGPVEFAIYRSATAIEGGDDFVPSANDDNLTLGCDDFGPLAIRIYAIDQAGNFDYCETSLLVQAFNDGVCEPGNSLQLGGTIMNAMSEPVEGVMVSISNPEASNFANQLTNASGIYYFSDLTLGEDYTIEAQNNPAISLNNVSTGDLVLIARHILGLNSFSSPYQSIAGDVTMDGNVNVLDIIQIRRVILGLDSEFAATNSWNFYVQDGEELQSVYNANNLSGNLLNADFVAIEMGNVSDVANNTNFQGEANGRADVGIHTNDINMSAGNTYKVTISGEDLYGMQGTFQFAAGLDVQDVNIDAALRGALNLEELATGMFSFSVVNTEAANQIGETVPQLEIVFRATRDGKLSEMLSLSDRITKAEAYTTAGENRSMELVFNLDPNDPATVLAAVGVRLLDNVPNPFRSQTDVRYELNQAQEVTLEVRDINGRIVLRKSQNGAAGLNKITVTKDEVGAAGVYEYSLITEGFAGSRKMVLIK